MPQRSASCAARCSTADVVPCQPVGVLGPRAGEAIVSGRFNAVLCAAPEWQRAPAAAAGWASIARCNTGRDWRASARGARQKVVIGGSMQCAPPQMADQVPDRHRRHQRSARPAQHLWRSKMISARPAYDDSMMYIFASGFALCCISDEVMGASRRPVHAQL